MEHREYQHEYPRMHSPSQRSQQWCSHRHVQVQSGNLLWNRKVRALSFSFFFVFFFARLSRSCGRHMLHSHPLEVTFTSTDHLVNNLPLLHEHESRHCLHCPFLCNSLQGKKSSPLFSPKQLTDSWFDEWQKSIDWHGNMISLVIDAFLINIKTFFSKFHHHQHDYRCVNSI